MARPQNFERLNVLKNATLVFWHQGFQGTSMKDLELATGLTPSSLYNSFGNKEALFLEVLDFYEEFVLGARIKKYLHQTDPITGLNDFFTTCFTDLPRGKKGMACLIVNSVAEMAIHNEAIRNRLQRTQEKLRFNFIKCIEKAKQNGTLSLDSPSTLLADQMLISLNGLLVASKVVKDNEKMVEASQQSLFFILGFKQLPNH